MTIFIFSDVFFRFFTRINTVTAGVDCRHLDDGTPHSTFHHQRTLTNMPLQHFPITYKAETKAHMSSLPLETSPHCSPLLAPRICWDIPPFVIFQIGVN